MWAVGYFSEYWPTGYWPSIDLPDGYYVTGTHLPVYSHTGVLEQRYYLTGSHTPSYSHAGVLDADTMIPYSKGDAEWSSGLNAYAKGSAVFAAGSSPYAKTSPSWMSADTPYRGDDE